MFAGQHEPNLCAVPLKLNSTMFALVTRLNAYQEIKKNYLKKNCFSFQVLPEHSGLTIDFESGSLRVCI